MFLLATELLTCNHSFKAVFLLLTKQNIKMTKSQDVDIHPCLSRNKLKNIFICLCRKFNNKHKIPWTLPLQLLQQHEIWAKAKVKSECTGVVFYLVLAQVWNPPRPLLGIVRGSPTVWDQYVLQSESRSTRMPSVFHAPGAVVRPCRPAEAACYSKWLWVTVVSVWPGIRNTIRLETDRERERWVHLENKQRSAELKIESTCLATSVFYTGGLGCRFLSSRKINQSRADFKELRLNAR